MEQTEETNRAIVSGCVQQAPCFSHTLFGEAFYTFPLAVKRLSGAVDVLPITVGERILKELPSEGDELLIYGQLRSYNMKYGCSSRLFITVFARNVSERPVDSPCCNEISLIGYVCKPPVYRTTPFSREITDVMLAVNRAYRKSDYLPIIAWGRNARYLSNMCVGDKLTIHGRAQSRQYQKALPDGSVLERVAYEVSAFSVEGE